MRLFQNASISKGYRERLRQLVPATSSFDAQLRAFLRDRYAALHILRPVRLGHPEAFFTNGNDERLQRAWAREHGMPKTASLADILLAQIEEHRADVFYNLDPITFDDSFVSRLPSSVKRRITWRAAPSPHERFQRYDLLVSNFPALLKAYAARGYRTAYFFPAHDEAMDEYAANTDRVIDILFVGGYSRHHLRRAQVLEAVAALSARWTVRLCLDRSLFTRLADSPLGLLPPLKRHKRPALIRAVSQAGVFGRALYEAISSAKVVLNAAVDMAGEERGNMRCFEAIGCGALLLSDSGVYPEGLEPNRTLVVYTDPADAVKQAERILKDDALRRAISERAGTMIRDLYSSERQWNAFVALCD